MKGSQPGERLRKPKWDMARLPRFEKNFYVEHQQVSTRTEVSTHYYKLRVKLKGTSWLYCPKTESELKAVYCRCHVRGTSYKPARKALNECGIIVRKS